MELLRKLGTRIDKNGYKRSWGLFKCPDISCGKEVERKLSDGKKQKFCGCNKIKFISELNKGKDFSGENNPFYGKNHTEETKQKNRDSHIGKEPGNKGKKATEETRQKMRKPKSEEHKKNLSDSLKGIQSGENNPMYGVHRFGEENPNWQNGKSFEIYPIEFQQIKQFILERDNYTCQCPDCKIENLKRLSVHHIDYDKNNNSPDNLITLCVSCHAKTVGKNNRNYFIKFYQTIMIGKVMECLL